jgi:hypothetical protein
MRLFLNERDGLLYNVINRALDTSPSLHHDPPHEATYSNHGNYVYLSVEDIVDGLWEQAAVCLAPSMHSMTSRVTHTVAPLALSPDIATAINEQPRIIQMLLRGNNTSTIARIETATERESDSETASSSNAGSPRVVDSDLEWRVDSTRFHA